MDRVLGLLTLLFALLARHSLLVLAVRLVERELDGFEVVLLHLLDSRTGENETITAHAPDSRL